MAREGLIGSWHLSAGFVLGDPRPRLAWKAFWWVTAWICVSRLLIGSAWFLGLGV